MEVVWALLHEIGSYVIAAILGGIATWAYPRAHDWIANWIPEQVRVFATQYESADWISDEPQRVARRNRIFEDMRQYPSTHRVSKRRLRMGELRGRYLALAAAILALPCAGDWRHVVAVDRSELLPGHAQFIFYDVVEMLLARKDLTPPGGRRERVRWACEMPNLHPNLQASRDALSRD